jgi:hypothetical protein
MKQNTKIILFLYNRFFDPLIQSNFWLYIDDYLKDPENKFVFHVISYEDDQHPITPEQQEKYAAWQKQGLEWTPLQWHPGTSFKSKLTDIIAGFSVAARLRVRGYRYVVSYGSIAGAYAYLHARVLGIRLFMHTFEPHSEYAIDNKMWQSNSIVYRVANFLERRAAHFAVSIASGTRFMEDRLKTDWKVKGRFFKIPSAADGQKFKFDQEQRYATRIKLNLRTNQQVLLYPGKFGSLYYREETAWMFRWLLEMEPSLHFLIVTPHEDAEVRTLFDIAGVPHSAYTIAHSDYADIHNYYSAADFAVIAVPPGPSKKFISNIKVGEYLCAGLPYLITRGVSEDYLVAQDQDVGVVVDDFREADIKAAWPQIKRFLNMSTDVRRTQCRQVGLGYRGFNSLNPVFKAALSHLVRS